MQNLQDVTAIELKMFIDFLKSSSLFEQKAPVERVEELVEIIDGLLMLNSMYVPFPVYDSSNCLPFAICLVIAVLQTSV